MGIRPLHILWCRGINVARVHTEPLEYRKGVGQLLRGYVDDYLLWLEISAQLPNICPTSQPAAECGATYAGEDDWLVFHGFFRSRHGEALLVALQEHMRNAH